MFRTPTGQTGRDAYTYELTAIENARRTLDARMSKLMDAMIEELPDTTTYQMPIPSDQFPDATLTADAIAIRKQLDMTRLADEFGFDFVRDILRTLTTDTEQTAA